MKTSNVLCTMAEIVEKRMELYKDDFYKYDTKYIFVKRPHEFVWFVRPTGTHLLTRPNNPEDAEAWLHVYEMFKVYNKWFYHVKMDADGSGEVTLSEKRCDEFARKIRRKA